MHMSPISGKRWWIAAATGYAVILAPAAAVASPGHPAAPAAASAVACTGWTVTKTPNPGSPGLTGVATTSSANAWAVGYYLNHQSGASTLIARWNGTAWKQVPSPNPGGPTGSNYLFGVAATSVTDAWAVGTYANGSVPDNLIEHWNGTRWARVPSPSPGKQLNRLEGVAATSATD